MTYKHFFIAAALSAYITVPLAFIVQKFTKDNQLTLTLAQEADVYGNNNGQLELTEIQDAYQRMGINPKAIIINSYQRLVTSGDPRSKDKPFDFRFPTESDLERGIRSYR